MMALHCVTCLTTSANCDLLSLANNIWYIVAGGGGAPRYAVNAKPNPHQIYAETSLHFCKLQIDGGYLTFEMIRSDGTVGDTLSITAPVAVTSARKVATLWGAIKVGRSR